MPYTRFAPCPECRASVGVVAGRLVTHDAPAPCRAVCSGSHSAEQLDLGAAKLVAAFLDGVAKAAGLDWTIAYQNADREPYAFRLVSEDGKAVEPAQVIGETEFDARDCISLAAASRPRRRARRRS